MKIKYLSILLAATLSSLTLTACSSGSGTNTGTSSNNPPITSPKDPAEDLGFDMIDPVKALAGQLAPYVENYITKGQFATDKEIFQQKLFSTLQDIKNQIQQVVIGNAENLMVLQQIQSQISNLQLAVFDNNLQSQLNIFQSNNQQVGSWINRSVYNGYINDPANKRAQNLTESAQIVANAAESVYLQQESGTLSNKEIAYIASVAQLRGFPIDADLGSQLDTTEENISCDGTVYDTGIGTTHKKRSTNCAVPELLNSMLSVYENNHLTENAKFTLNNNATGYEYGVPGTNSLITFQQYSNSLDLLYAELYSYYSSLFTIDQMRAFIYTSITDGDQYTSLPTSIGQNGVDNYTNALADLKLAFTTKLSLIHDMIEANKLAAYNATFGPAASTSLSTNCSNVSFAFLESVPVTPNLQNNAQAASANNTPYWDTQTLVASCTNQGGVGTLNGNLTTTNNISQLCIASPNPTGTPFANSYNIMVNNGYIKCNGQGTNNTPNYSISNYQNWWWNNNGSYSWGGGNGLIPASQLVLSANNFYRQLDSTPLYVLGYPELSGNYQFSTKGNLDFTFYNGANVIEPTVTTANGSYSSYTFPGSGTPYINVYMSGGTDFLTNQPWSLVDDGIHAYLLNSVYWGGYNELGIGGGPEFACIPGDANCVQGVANSGQFLAFNNGDVITITQLGSSGDYNIVSYYSGSQSPINVSSLF